MKFFLQKFKFQANMESLTKMEPMKMAKATSMQMMEGHKHNPR
jgi:hypothetical protein